MPTDPCHCKQGCSELGWAWFPGEGGEIEQGSPAESCAKGDSNEHASLEVIGRKACIHRAPPSEPSGEDDIEEGTHEDVFACHCALPILMPASFVLD